MKLLGILKNILFEEKISNPIVDVNLNDYKIRFILSTHAQERMTRKENAQEFFIVKTDSGLQINCKVLNFNKNRGEIEIIIKTLMKSHTNQLNINNSRRNTLHLNIIENLDEFDNYFTITV